MEREKEQERGASVSGKKKREKQESGRARRKGEGETDRRARFSDRAVCTRTKREKDSGVTGGPFPSIAWLHPHAAVKAHNLATVARYNRYCGRGLNGGELAQVKPPHRHDNPSAGGATPRLCSLTVVSHPTQPLRVLLTHRFISFLPSTPTQTNRIISPLPPLHLSCRPSTPTPPRYEFSL